MPSWPDPRCKRRWRWGEYHQKVALFERAVAQCNAFLELNNLPTLSFDNHQLNGPLSVYKPRAQRVRVDVRRTFMPLGILSRCDPACFPGAHIDRTALGVCGHEVGHHLVNVLRLESRIPDWSYEVPIVGMVERRHNRVESLALATRLFITNPDLLMRGRPVRYWYLTQQLHLRPVETRRWEDVLHGADPAVFAAVYSWVANGLTSVLSFLDA